MPRPVGGTAPMAIAHARLVPGDSVDLDYPHAASGSFPSAESSLPADSPVSCEGCQHTMGHEDDGCVGCPVDGIECSARKRKLSGDGGDDGDSCSKRSSPTTSSRIGQQASLSSTAASSTLVEDMANFGGPTLLKRTLGLQTDRYSQYIGPTTDFEPSLINLSPFDPYDESLLARGTLRKVSDQDTFLLLPDERTPGYEHVMDDLDAIEGLVAPYGRQLIDLYFRVVHPGFPILQKTVFYEMYERSLREVSPPLLAAMYILAINWWHHAEQLAPAPKPNVGELERLVRTTLADAMNRPKLSTIQAGLLLSQCPEGDQWAPTAQLVAVGQELGLHLDCSAWNIAPWERGLRKRLSWALFMQDKWGALVHGRPSHVLSSNWAVQPLRPNDFPDVEWDEEDVEERAETQRGRLLFTEMVQLSQILAETLETFYTLQASQAVAEAGASGYHVVLELAKPIQLRLKKWYGALPPPIRMDSPFQTNTTASHRLSPVGYLHLAYFATEITLHRRIIRSMDASAAAEGSSAVDPYVQHICRGAAKARLISAMDFVNRLTPSHLRGFWYFASKTNFALIGTFGSLLWATSPGRMEAEWYRRRLGEYRWTLSVSSKPVGAGGEGQGGGLTEFAMGMLDISTGLLKKLPEKPLLSPCVPRSSTQVVLGCLPMSAPNGLLDGDSRAQSPESATSESSDEAYEHRYSAVGSMSGVEH